MPEAWSLMLTKPSSCTIALQTRETPRQLPMADGGLLVGEAGDRYVAFDEKLSEPIMVIWSPSSEWA